MASGSIFNDLLTQMLQGGMGGTPQRRINKGLGRPNPPGGGLDGLAEVLAGRRQAPPADRMPGGDIGDLLREMTGGGPGAGGGYGRAQAPMPQGGGYGRGMPFPTPQPRRSGGGIGLGGMAVLGALGALAFKALQKTMQAKQAQAQTEPAPRQAPTDERIPFPQAEAPSRGRSQELHWPEEPAQPPRSEPVAVPVRDERRDQTPAGSSADDDTEQAARTVLAAMINAAKADGKLDRAEIDKILGSMTDGGASPAAQAFIREEVAKPFDLERIAAEVRDPQTAVEVYVGSILAIEIDTQAEADYVRRLADRLGLPPQVVQAIHQQVGAPLPA